MQLYWVWFALVTGLSLRQKMALLERFSDPEEIYTMEALPDGTELDKDLEPAQTVLNQCRRKNIGILPLGDAAYPDRLRYISDPPLVLYYRGILPDFERVPAIGVVGTRKATPYGLNTAKTLASQIAACGALVVSGGAAGIDTSALEGALAESHTAVAVLGNGVDVVYPTTNRKLFMEVEEKGCLISEYPPGTGPKPWHFPARNRIISGMSNGILVVEAPKKSGALITARDAMEQGRDVFAVPGNIDMETCEGSNLLLQEGASAVFSGWDVVREYAVRYPRIQPKPQKLIQPVAVPEEQGAVFDKKDIDIPTAKPYSDLVNGNIQLTQQEEKLLACVDRKPVPMDTVIARAQLPAATVLSMLTKLSLRGLVRNHPGKLVSRNQ